jgi:uncharacterized membrane protein
MNTLFLAVLLPLLLTVAIEGSAVLIIFRQKKYGYFCLLCNLLTNPALNLLLLVFVSLFGARAYYPVLVPAEIAVVFIEAAVYNYICQLGMKKAIMLSAFLNAMSFAAGVLINHLSKLV